MTVKTCLKLAKEFGDAGDSQLSLFYLNRARSKVARFPKYKGMEIVGFELKPKSQPKPEVKKETKKDGKKSKG